jgi:hypothetical protein
MPSRIGDNWGQRMSRDQEPISRQRSPVPGRILGGIVLGILTVVFFGIVVQKLPSYTIVQEVTEYSTLPALWVTHLILPDGPHSGAGLQFWNPVYWASGIVIYSLFWFIVLSLLWGTRRTVYARR